MNKSVLSGFMILIGMASITVSCEKQQRCDFSKAQLIVDETQEKGGDEDPVIMVRVKKKHGFAPIGNATVEIFDYVTSLRVGSGITDSLGAYQQSVVTGVYFFRVTEPISHTIYITDSVHVNKDVQAAVVVD